MKMFVKNLNQILNLVSGNNFIVIRKRPNTHLRCCFKKIEYYWAENRVVTLKKCRCRAIHAETGEIKAQFGLSVMQQIFAGATVGKFVKMFLEK